VVGSSRAGTRDVESVGPNRRPDDAGFRIASLTKVFTATALVLTLRERAIPVRTPVRELLPHLADDGIADRDLTVEQLLGQVSGLRAAVESPAVAALGDGDEALGAAARLVVRAGHAREPGARWEYYNGNYFLAGALLAAVRGTTYEAALAATVLEPWGLTRTGFEPANGYPRGRRPSGGLWSCAADLLTFGETLLADRDLLDELRRVRTAPGDPMCYGLGWAIGPSGQMYLNGRLPGYRAALLLVPDNAYVSVALTDDERALPAVARVISDLQQPLTGDDLATAIDQFAA
jgi:D-alanyl-D-alanine carboxypeptidase